MSLTKKLLDPFYKPPDPNAPISSVAEELERRAKVVEGYMFQICTNLSLAEQNIGDRRDFYLDKAIKACRGLQEWSTS